ncbi:hypothetical protein L226DRAFT_573629 [Lentinus tigrinus ALCF2SS1-7]|uniref:Uncharacterized protein n=1 Tax=Lentinus tigrinus ALCF2SS1-6 TaxID=1328759 RepID=A0A5C2S8L1_9APHY|nr:hypothetical protein L227DRAFT_613371 [Lentinus tigrinus ALCF2SS1-6]RPD71970.1 hypothetical protein L226DRAFT_573629 [Lentinus tigrinus ALCF2SS1-7]
MSPLSFSDSPLDPRYSSSPPPPSLRIAFPHGYTSDLAHSGGRRTSAGYSESLESRPHPVCVAQADEALLIQMNNVSYALLRCQVEHLMEEVQALEIRLAEKSKFCEDLISRIPQLLGMPPLPDAQLNAPDGRPQCHLCRPVLGLGMNYPTPPSRPPNVQFKYWTWNDYTSNPPPKEFSKLGQHSMDENRGQLFIEDKHGDVISGPVAKDIRDTLHSLVHSLIWCGQAASNQDNLMFEARVFIHVMLGRRFPFLLLCDGGMWKINVLIKQMYHGFAHTHIKPLTNSSNPPKDEEVELPLQDSILDMTGMLKKRTHRGSSATPAANSRPGKVARVAPPLQLMVTTFDNNFSPILLNDRPAPTPPMLVDPVHTPTLSSPFINSWAMSAHDSPPVQVAPPVQVSPPAQASPPAQVSPPTHALSAHTPPPLSARDFLPAQAPSAHNSPPPAQAPSTRNSPPPAQGSSAHNSPLPAQAPPARNSPPSALALSTDSSPPSPSISGCILVPQPFSTSATSLLLRLAHPDAPSQAAPPSPPHPTDATGPTSPSPDVGFNLRPAGRAPSEDTASAGVASTATAAPAGRHTTRNKSGAGRASSSYKADVISERNLYLRRVLERDPDISITDFTKAYQALSSDERLALREVCKKERTQRIANKKVCIVCYGGSISKPGAPHVRVDRPI